MRRKWTCVLLTVLLLGSAGCTANSSPHKTAASCNAQCQSNENAACAGECTAGPGGAVGITSATPTTSTASDALTGFGATLATWNLNHEPDSDPQLAANCCYGPQIDSPEGRDEDTFYAVLPEGGLVVEYSRRFPINTDDTLALNLLIATDLPPDAKFIAKEAGDGCEQYKYGSALLAKQDTGVGPVFTFALYSENQNVYNPDSIASAILTASDSFEGGC